MNGYFELDAGLSFLRAAYRRLLIACVPMRLPAFGAQYYASRYPEISDANLRRHFIKKGWREGRSPADNFNIFAFLIGAPMSAVRGLGDDIGRDYMRIASSSRWVPAPARAFARDYLSISDSGRFDGGFYKKSNPEVVGDELEHYLRCGWREGCDPSPDFSSQAYLGRYPDVAAAGVNPLLHFINCGCQEGRFPLRLVTGKISDDPVSLSEPYSLQLEAKRAEVEADVQQRLFPSDGKCSMDGPQISLLVPVYNVSVHWFRQMIGSVIGQTYQNWQLCIVDDCSTSEELRQYVRCLPAVDRRIKVHFRGCNGGISAASNDALAMADGEYVALLDNDDMLTHDALEEMVKGIRNFDNPDWIYSDEFKIDENNIVSSLFPKPDWSPFLLLNFMYTCHFTLYRINIVKEVGGFRSRFDFSQDYDLALRVSELSIKIHHVEKYLYGWRMIETSAASGGKPTARISNIAALQDAVERRDWGGEVIALPAVNRSKMRLNNEFIISIIISSDNCKYIMDSVNSIRNESSYRNYEIIIVSRYDVIIHYSHLCGSENVKYIENNGKFNLSDKYNLGAQAAMGDYVVFFNDGVRVISQDWMESLLEYLSLPGVGVVGPKLLYENGLIEHAGMGTGMRRVVGTVFHCYPDSSPVHFNFAQCVRDVSLICGALLAMPRKVFDEIGGFDAENTPVSHSAVDLCFRVRDAGYRCVYTPYAKLTRIGHVSIGAEEATSSPFERDKSVVYLLKRWGEYVAYDPYYTPAMRELTYIDSPEPFQIFAGGEGGDSGDVLIIAHDLSSSGEQKLAYDLAVVLKNSGYFVTVISPVDGLYRERLVDLNVTVIIDALILTGDEGSLALARSFDLVITNRIGCWPVIDKLSKSTPIYFYSRESEVGHSLVSAHAGFLIALRSATGIWCGSQCAMDALAHQGLSAQVLEYDVDDLGAKA